MCSQLKKTMDVLKTALHYRPYSYNLSLCSTVCQSGLHSAHLGSGWWGDPELSHWCSSSPLQGTFEREQLFTVMLSYSLWCRPTAVMFSLRCHYFVVVFFFISVEIAIHCCLSHPNYFWVLNCCLIHRILLLDYST